MAITSLESRLPHGKQASDLGESDSKGKFHLISFLTRPLVTGQLNTYVVFSVGSNHPTKFKWTISPAGDDSSAKPVVVETPFPQILWRIGGAGKWVIQVELWNSQKIETLKLTQEVNSTSENIETLTKFINNDRITLIGNIEALQNIVYDFEGYIEEFTGKQQLSIPVGFVAALIHESITSGWQHEFCRYQKSDRQALKKGGVVALKTKSLQQIFHRNEQLGICRICPDLMGLFLGLLPETDKALLEDRFKKPFQERRAIRKAFMDTTKVSLEKRVDLFNLLRFPKTHLAVVVETLGLIWEAWRDAPVPLEGEGPPGLEKPGGMIMVATVFARTIQNNLPKYYLRKNKRFVQYHSNFFGRSVEAASRYPAITVLISPSTEMQLVMEEWEGKDLESEDQKKKHKDIQKHFHAKVVHYAVLRANYIKQLTNLEEDRTRLGLSSDIELLPNVMKWMRRNLIPIYPNIFQPRKGRNELTIHRDLQIPLMEVFGKLPSGIQFTRMSGFVPRLMNNKSKRNILSNHARGLAIDFDPHANPQMFRPAMFAIGELIEDPAFGTRSDDFESLARIHKNFRDIMANLNQSSPDIFSDNTSSYLTNYFPILLAWYENGGILTLERQFVKLMKESGFEWGGEWISQRDIMHFEFNYKTKPKTK